MSQSDERPAGQVAEETRARLDQLNRRVDAFGKEQRFKAEDDRRATDRAHMHGRVRAVGVIIISALFAGTLGPWLTVPDSGPANEGIDAWSLSGLQIGTGGQAYLYLFLLVVTVVAATWAALVFTVAAGVTAAISGTCLFAAEIYLETGLSSAISQGNLSSGSGDATAHLGAGLILEFVVTVLLVIWAVSAAVNARQFPG